ncbi:replication initiator protein A [Staphylococcus epidermidis]|uniref:replication initiator protein A n=1 Tax=Staphylococcus epidermidis TaxID=1282 RepID=UPI0019D09D19|nr:replication initiator protein A [Staphylococcus epidermidis]MBN6837014.1 replication initiator protein A [Staphylococcus epidermidis]MCG1702955.1 replication initiator protein A [Staphylococcus epidermidis]MCG2046993.1 replication initiator protein A [Staphylococcus epidermidis]MCG2186903.1 replication initiator protein A [Staphylococcus epidermidis]MCG2193648.1 replication initiator protein A [Staphylococcus epidermidis]
MSNNFNINEIQREKFYQLPKVFFTNPKYTKISNDAKIAYAILRDRLDLSIKNNWIDENGDIFFIFTNETLKEILNISSPNKLSKIKKELQSAELFSQIRVGLNKPNKLYIKKPVVTKDDVYLIKQDENPLEISNDKDVSKSYVQKYQNHTSRRIKIIHQDVSKSYANDTNINDTDYKETENNDTYYMNDSEHIDNHNTSHSNHTNHQSTEFNNEALKYHLLQEMPDQLQNYLNNFRVSEIQIIKSVILKAKTSFNNEKNTVYMLEDIEFEMINVLKRFKATLIQKNENVEAMQGYLMRSIKTELEEMHSLNMRCQNAPQNYIFDTSHYL